MSDSSNIADIRSRTNMATRPDGSPYLIACQGDVDAILLEGRAQHAQQMQAIQNRDKAGIDPAQSGISMDQLRTYSGSATEPDLVPWIIPMYPPHDGMTSEDKGTERALIYAIGASRKARIEIYGFANPNIADAIVARIRKGGWDYKFMLNHDGYMSDAGVKAGGNVGDVIDAKNADGTWKYPEFHNNPNFILAKSTYRVAPPAGRTETDPVIEGQPSTYWVGGSDRINHRKCGSFDDQVAFVGSTNWADSDNNKQAQELHWIAQQGVVKARNAEFDRTWTINKNRGKAHWNIP